MSNILALKTSILGENSVSSLLVDEFIAQWQAKDSDTQVVTRDLGESPIPHLDVATLGAWMTDADQRTPEQQEKAALSEQLIAEVNDADLIVVGVPMYNLNVPSNLKSWVDQIARAGVTFRYTPEGPVGLIKDKRVLLLLSRGGQYKGTSFDTQLPYLNNLFAFLGLEDITAIHAEGINMGEDIKEQAIADAKKELTDFIANS